MAPGLYTDIGKKTRGTENLSLLFFERFSPSFFPLIVSWIAENRPILTMP
jgi:hypothetical protein